MPETRDRFLTATNELFRRQGYNGTSLKQVTEAAGAPTGSLYHYFPGGKDELTAAVLVTSGGGYRALLDLIWDEAGDPVAAVGALFDGAADVLEETDFIDPCPIGTVAREVASVNPQLRAVADGVFGTWIDAATARIEAAGVDPAAAADLGSVLVAAIEGAFILARTARDGDIIRRHGRVLQRLTALAMEGAVQV